MYNAGKWVNKKLNQGVSREELLDSVGIFSNRKKIKVMAEKKLTEKQYKQRYDFLHKVYLILNDSYLINKYVYPKKRKK